MAEAQLVATEVIVVAGIAGAVIMVATALWAGLTLRGAAAHRDLAADHEPQVSRAPRP